MKKMLLSLFTISILCTVGSAYGQVTNLQVNKQTTSFTMTSGDTLTWSYDVPTPGDTTLVEVWIDKDNSGTITSGDFMWVYFIQIDGDPRGHNGPPDIDGTKDGHVSFGQPIGLAPAHYILAFKNHDIVKTVSGTVTALASPTFTISGNISNGSSGVQNAAVNLEAQNGNSFWTAITDANGDFTVQMSADTTGNPWKLRVDNMTAFGPDIISPDGYTLTLDKSVATSYPNNDFTVTTASASVTGTLYGDNGKPMINTDVDIYSMDGSVSRNTVTDTAGVFKIGLLSGELPATNLNLNAGDSRDTSIVVPQYTFASVKSGDNLTHDLWLFNTNSTITGRITVGGNAPGYMIDVYAQNADTGFTQTQTNNDGYYKIHVSDKIHNYTIALGNSVQGYTYTTPVVQAGATNVDINLVQTAISEDSPSVPASYSLSQNYPNPFNPTTQITYQLKNAQHVRLTVYDITGREVALLVNQMQSAGKHTVTFQGDNLSTGIYFYRLKAGNFSSTRKMILLK